MEDQRPDPRPAERPTPVGGSPWEPAPASVRPSAPPAAAPPLAAPAPHAPAPGGGRAAPWPGPPVAGPPGPPFARPPVAGPPPALPPARRRPSTGRAGLAALAVAAVFAAGAGGVLVGREVADDGAPGAAPDAAATASEPIAAEPGPVDPDAVEPAAAVAEALGPAVVQIETRTGLGSGFVYDDEGLVLTAAHVVADATEVTVRMADGSRREGEVLGTDDSTDVAVVQIEGSDDLPVAELATGVELQVGQTAIAIGSPFGLDQTVTAGIVSAVGRSTETPGGVIPAIQTDAPINSGNSGGALADRQGRVIGINDSIITGNVGSTGNVGVGFAIPIDIAKAVADKIVAGESTEAGFLGVGGADATGDRAGAAITEVEPGSPADEAGITDDDVVTAVDGRDVSSMVDLAAAVRTKEPGDEVTLTLLRDGEERTVEVTLAAAEASGARPGE